MSTFVFQNGNPEHGISTREYPCKYLILNEYSVFEQCSKLFDVYKNEIVGFYIFSFEKYEHRNLYLKFISVCIRF